ncbi:hypothetical protein F5X96DRAFT_212208 [Biscogniauxia mediterranea]|nr:hypothetical protein F5X96DRAFT_212208 [Biscogniauxia mediterranea]
MATQQDLQELLRLMTLGMKVPIKDALVRVKALQAKDLRSIQQIADSPLAHVESAIKDSKAARSLHNACKARLKTPNASSATKRSGSDLTSDAKRSKSSGHSGHLGGQDPVAPHEFEASLELPVEIDQDAISSTVLFTNRAPLVLAFAVELLRYTMPEQPPSSRLSLAQAVVSANSRSRAVTLGMEKGPSADEEGWGQGQPKVRVMGREVTVLKRSGYEWKGDEEVEHEKSPAGSQGKDNTDDASGVAGLGGINTRNKLAGALTSQTSTAWAASQPVTLKNSRFIVRATSLTDPSQRQSALQSLFSAIPSLETATHNAWAYRVKVPTNLFNATTIKEDSFDDGETGCGDFLLKNMREMNTVNTLVVMTRWYGGFMLGPDRWRIMRNCLKDALAERLRVTGEQVMLGGEALWGLDLEAMKSKSGSTGDASSRSYEAGVVGMPIHRPEAARAYLFKSFAARIEGSEDGQAGLTTNDKTTAPPKKKTAKTLELEKEENVARLLGAIRLLFDSWADHLSASDLDRRAWNWYVAVRPEVENGPSGWGAKGRLKLADILALRRKAE